MIFRPVKCTELQRPHVADFSFFCHVKNENLACFFPHSFWFCLTTPEIKTDINTVTARLNQSRDLSNSAVSPGEPNAVIGRYKKAKNRQLLNKWPYFLMYVIIKRISVILPKNRYIQ